MTTFLLRAFAALALVATPAALSASGVSINAAIAKNGADNGAGDDRGGHGGGQAGDDRGGNGGSGGGRGK